jgi:hypothetical protein
MLSDVESSPNVVKPTTIIILKISSGLSLKISPPLNPCELMLIVL